MVLLSHDNLEIKGLLKNGKLLIAKKLRFLKRRKLDRLNFLSKKFPNKKNPGTNLSENTDFFIFEIIHRLSYLMTRHLRYLKSGKRGLFCKSC
jgi:hypothetical protein